jgi:hypothetical protein
LIRIEGNFALGRMMKEVVINSLSVLHDIIEKYDARAVVYRGMKSVKFPLMPKVGRIISPKSVGSKEANEKEILRLFKERALRFFLDFVTAND